MLAEFGSSPLGGSFLGRRIFRGGMPCGSATGDELREAFEGFGADMMLDALRVNCGGLLVDAQSKQELIDDLVPLATFFCQPSALSGQLDRLVGVGKQEFFAN